MDVKEYEMPDDLHYHKEHMWAKIEGNNAKVGLNDFSQKLAGEISYVEPPYEDDTVTQDDEVGTVETGKWVGKLYAPVSGTVCAVNDDLRDDPTMINSDPYGEGWIFEIEMRDPDELNNLMKKNDTVEWLKTVKLTSLI